MILPPMRWVKGASRQRHPGGGCQREEVAVGRLTHLACLFLDLSYGPHSTPVERARTGRMGKSSCCVEGVSIWRAGLASERQRPDSPGISARASVGGRDRLSRLFCASSLTRGRLASRRRRRLGFSGEERLLARVDYNEYHASLIRSGVRCCARAEAIVGGRG